MCPYRHRSAGIGSAAPSSYGEPYVARAVTAQSLELHEARGRNGDDMSNQPRVATAWLVPKGFTEGTAVGITAGGGQRRQAGRCALSKLGGATAKTRRILPAPEDPKGMHYLRRVGRVRQGPDNLLRPSDPHRLSVVARQLNHFDDMSADVVATQGPGCCDPMMAVENVVLAAPCPHLDGWEWLNLAHGDQYAAQAGASSITDRPELPVEQLRCAVSRPYDAGDRDELFTGLPKLPGLPGDLLQQRKSRASTAAQHWALRVRIASAATDQSRMRCPRGRTRLPAVECGPATIRSRRRMAPTVATIPTR
jgi:hypothetical protein